MPLSVSAVGALCLPHFPRCCQLPRHHTKNFLPLAFLLPLRRLMLELVACNFVNSDPVQTQKSSVGENPHRLEPFAFSTYTISPLHYTYEHEHEHGFVLPHRELSYGWLGLESVIQPSPAPLQLTLTDQALHHPISEVIRLNIITTFTYRIKRRMYPLNIQVCQRRESKLNRISLVWLVWTNPKHLIQ